MIRVLRSTSCQGERHGLGKGEERIWERRREWQGKAGGGAGANGEGRGGRGEKVVCWLRMCWITGRSMRGVVPIRFGTYNVRNGGNGGLESALRGVSQANMDLGIFK